MNKQYKDEIVGKIIFFIASVFILIKILVPVIYPASLASTLYDGNDIYKRIIDKSNAYIETIMDYNNYDEDKKELLSILFKYLTGIDLSDPKSYITSQIPVLQFIDVTSIVSKENGPVIVVPKVLQEEVINENNDTNVNNDNDNSKTTDNLPNTNNNQNEKNNENNNTDIPLKVIVGNIKPIKKMKLDPKKPLVLIYHTHTTENYNPQNKANEDYTTDPNKGVSRVGEELKKELQNVYGIAAIHDTTVYDLPKREGAYAKSRPTVEKYVKKYPSLKIIIDLHRDGNVNVNRTTALIKNERYARVMFVVGTNNKNHSKSEIMARRINDVFDYLYPNFSRGIMFKKGVYNQDLSSKIVLIEVGSDGNDLDEALRTTKVIARVIAQCLN